MPVWSKSLWVIIKRGKPVLYVGGARKGTPKVFGRKEMAKDGFLHGERGEELRRCRVMVKVEEK